MWPFSRKASTALQLKSTSFLFGMGAYSGTFTKAGFNLFATEGYLQNPVVHACVNKIATAIASIDPQLYQRDKKGKLTQIDSHPLLALIENPNPGQSGKEFIRHMVSYYLTGGNVYLYGNQLTGTKPPTELQLFNPGNVTVKPGKTIFPTAYEYKPTIDQTLIFPVDQVTGRSAVMQFKTFNPLNPWYGISPMMAAAFGIDIHNGGQKWNKRLLDNDARPSGALTVKGADGKPATLTEDQYERLKEQIENQYSGASNAGRPMLLEGGLEWQQLSMSAKDIDFLKGKDSAARDIGLVFGVPSQLLQIPGDSTFANYEQATLSFWTDTVIPLATLFFEGLNRWLTPLYGDNLYLWYDENSIIALEPRRKDLFDRVKTADFMTIDEKRQAVGMDSFPHKLGESLLLEGRGVLLGADGSIVALATNTNTDPGQDPLIDPNAKPPVDPVAAKQWLLDIKYCDAERAERLAKLMYG